MTSPFLTALRSGRVLLMDGAMGTELQKAGLQPGECAELWNLTHPERIQAVHEAYVDAGAEVVLTHSFLANPERFEQNGLLEALGDANSLAVQNANIVAHGKRHVLADVGPFSGTSDRLLEMCSPFLDCSAILLETWSDQAAAGAFLANLRTHRTLCEIPLLLSVTYNRDWLRDPASNQPAPEHWAVWTARHKQIVALGVNCGREIGIADCAEIVRRYRTVTDLPLFARPNAGTPTKEGERWIYSRSLAQMAAELPLLREAGVSMVGGCCGTTPAHTAAFRKVIDQWNARKA